MASLMPIEHYPLLRHRRESALPWPQLRPFVEENRDYIEAVYREVADRGPLKVSDLEDAGRRTGPWWGRSRGKIALEWLFETGRLAASGRHDFARVYDITERVIPPDVLAGPPLSRPDAEREMLRLAGLACGVGTLADLADYYRIRTPQARPRVQELVEAGELIEARVEGWSQPAYQHREARVPRRVHPGRSSVRSIR